MAGRKSPPAYQYHCAMCDQQFPAKKNLTAHMRDHEDVKPAGLSCPECNWPFEDSLALDDHMMKNGHGTPRFTCKTCGKGFMTPRLLEDHKNPLSGCSQVLSVATNSTPVKVYESSPFTCDRCTKTFTTRKDYENHRNFKTNGPCADHNHKTPPKDWNGRKDSEVFKRGPVGKALGYASSDEHKDATVGNESEIPTDLSEGDIYCQKCKSRFKSQAAHINHTLWCFTKHRSTGEEPVLNDKQPASDVIEPILNDTPPTSKFSEPILNNERPASEFTKPIELAAPQSKNKIGHSGTPSQKSSSSGEFRCDIQGCKKFFRSDSALRQHQFDIHSEFRCDIQGCKKAFRLDSALQQHKVDTHGVRGQSLDLMGFDSWMPSQRTREQAKNEGRLKAIPTGPARGGRGARLPPPPPISMAKARQQHLTTTPTPTPKKLPQYNQPSPSAAIVHLSRRDVPVNASSQLPFHSYNTGGVLEMEQAKFIRNKTLRLLIQSDIFIRNDGKISVSGILWTRIGVERQSCAVDMFDAMCHLPKILQGEYLPPPTTFSKDYEVQYPVSEFESSTARASSKPGLSVVALACSKVLLANDLQEVVRIAAVDLITCRILLNHLVCTDGTTQVKNWRSNETGLFSWNDMEQARKLGFKIFKGWSAARSALYKFIDKETIIVGHNLRSDLDCLRMVHGRAVDIAKVAEKAAKGPLSKPQLSLESLCRDFLQVTLKSDANYGRDVLMNAFAVREMGLWIVKNKDMFETTLKKKSLEYQTIMSRSVAA